MSVEAYKDSKAAPRRNFIGGSDARIIVGTEQGALTRLWREKRGEIAPQDLSGNLVMCSGGSFTQP